LQQTVVNGLLIVNTKAERIVVNITARDSNKLKSFSYQKPKYFREDTRFCAENRVFPGSIARDSTEGAYCAAR